MHYLQTKDGMFKIMKPYVLLANVLMMMWFIAIQYYRFMPNGRACAGDFVDSKKMPSDYGKVYLPTWGTFIVVYIIAHYIALLFAVLVTRKINNKHKQEYEKKKALMINEV